MIRKLFVLVLIGLGFFAGVYWGVTMMRPRPAAPATSVTTGKPAAPAPRATEEARPTAPTPPAPERPSRRAPARRAEAAARPAPSSVETAPVVGILNIETDVPGAQVFIDRQFIGAAPVTGHELAPGSYRVNVAAPGFEGVVETIDVAPGPRDLMIKLREVRLEAGIDVIHKHRIGACKGRLTATAQGMRYDTTDKDDLFSSTLLDIETFEVDYLNKNLKVKIRKGKTYDFTDPAGNADRLFVFHRDVDKARGRLQKGDPPASSK